VGKKDPTYAVNAGDDQQSDAHWWAAKQDMARAWTGLDGMKRFLRLCGSSKLHNFIVVGTDASETRADMLVQVQNSSR